MREKRLIVLGDIVASRDITEKLAFQERLSAAIKKINARYFSDFHAPLKTIKGLDEFGAALNNLQNFFRIVTTLGEELHPQLMRASLVFGYIDTGWKTRDIAKMDGPAIHKASALIDELKNKRLFFEAVIADPLLDGALAGQLNLLGLLKKNWSARQMLIFKEYRALRNQQRVADKLGITQQAVSSTLQRCRYREIEILEQRLNDAFYRYSLSVNKSREGDR